MQQIIDFTTLLIEITLYYCQYGGTLLIDFPMYLIIIYICVIQNLYIFNYFNLIE